MRDLNAAVDGADLISGAREFHSFTVRTKKDWAVAFFVVLSGLKLFCLLPLVLLSALFRMLVMGRATSPLTAL